MEFAGWNLLDLSAIVAIVAAALIAFRLVTTWDDTTSLVHALAGVLFLLLAVSAYASVAYSKAGVEPIPGATTAVIVARFAVLAVGLAWPVLQTRQRDASKANRFSGLR